MDRKIFVVLLMASTLFAQRLLANEMNQPEVSQQKDNQRLSFGLFSSADSIKTTVNLEFGYTLYESSHFQVRSLTAITGSKIYDDAPNLYQLGLMEKFTFGNPGTFSGILSTSRYGFFFMSFGFLSFDQGKQAKFLFASPYYWEIGGGAGINFRLSNAVAFFAEIGGGLHLINDGKLDFMPKLDKAGFGRMSLGFRYFL